MQCEQSTLTLSALDFHVKCFSPFINASNTSTHLLEHNKEVLCFTFQAVHVRSDVKLEPNLFLGSFMAIPSGL